MQNQLSLILLQLPQLTQQNCEHSQGRFCLLQWYTEHKMVGQHAQGNMWPKLADPFLISIALPIG